jgi:predicted permease
LTQFTDPNFEWVVAMARMRPGVNREQAQAALSPQFDEWMRTVNTVRARSDLPKLMVRDGSAGLNGLRYQYSKPLIVLLGLVALILALACANIANLLLARATARRREIAVRLGIGAGRWRLIRQLLTESILLASLGGAAGIAVALWGIRVLTALIGGGREGFTVRADLNWRVLLVVASLSVVTGILFGLAPALQATRVNLLSSLKESRTGSGGRGARRLTLSRVLMAAQIAISLLILVCAGLFVRTLSKLESIDLGFNRENILTFSLSATQAGHQEPEVFEFYNNLRARLAEIPGVRNASMSDYLLVSGRTMTGVSVGAAAPKTALIMSVGPEFFSTMQIPVRMGRAIEDRDMTRTHIVAVVNQTFVDRRLDGRNPLGQILHFHNSCSTCEVEIVGVSGNALIGPDVLDKGGPTVFLPYSGNIMGKTSSMYFELRTSGNPMRYTGAVRQLVREADPLAPVTEVQTQSAEIDGTISREVIFARLCTGFGLLALAIACVGLYGAMSYTVARRTSEIGIRMALGALPAQVVWMVLDEVVLLAAAGLAIGIPAALYGTKFLKSFLFEIEPRDPASLTMAAVSLVVVSVLAGYLPARNASRVDPMRALRHE